MISILALVSMAVMSEALELGYGVLVNPTDGASSCVLPVLVKPEDAGENCQVEVFVDRRVGRAYSLLWKPLASAGGFDAEKHKVFPRDGFSDRFLADCKFAGEYGLSMSVDDDFISSASSGLRSLDTISVVRRDPRMNNYHIRPIAGQRTGDMALGQGRWLVLHLNLTPGAGATVTPHVDVDLSGSSKLDNLNFYLSRNGTDVTVDSPDRVQLDADATLDVFTEPLTAGQYQLGIYAANTVGGNFVHFSLGYELNSEASDVAGHPLFVCPSEECFAENMQSCRSCTAGSCNWCASTNSCSNVANCPAKITTEISECVDLGAVCGAHIDCGQCTDDERCVWCDRPLAGDACSPGKDDLGQVCPTAWIGATSIKIKAECPATIEEMARMKEEAAQAADDACAAHATCTECALDPNCIYCDVAVGNDRCTTGGEKKECPSVFNKGMVTDDPSECADTQFCSGFSKCAQCANERDCGWCDATASCLPMGAECGVDEEVGSLIVAPDTCPRCTGEECSCKSFSGNCAACTNVSGCIFCTAINGQGACTSGVDDLALECESALDRKRVQCSECAEDPDRLCASSAASVVASLSLLVLAFL